MNRLMKSLFSPSRIREFIVYSLSMVALALTVAACSGTSNESSLSSAKSSVNLCIGQAANTFQCLDDTSFQHCTGNGNFAVNSCPAGLCATRTPSDRNPCIGRQRAAEIDGVEPPAAGKANPPATGNATGNAGANTGGAVNTGANPGGANAQCVGGPKFDPAGAKNVGNARGIQFIGGQCLSAADCASGCCAGPCGICSGVGAQTQAGKTGCGFGG